MKYLVAISLILLTGFAHAEKMDYKTLTGIFVTDSDCVETGYALKTQERGNVCVGFHSSDLTEKDLVLGNEYSFGGYETEDGFFITEFAD